MQILGLNGAAWLVFYVFLHVQVWALFPGTESGQRRNMHVQAVRIVFRGQLRVHPDRLILLRSRQFRAYPVLARRLVLTQRIHSLPGNRDDLVTRVPERLEADLIRDADSCPVDVL